MLKFLGFVGFEKDISLSVSLSKQHMKEFEANFEPMINTFTPKSIFIACDIVQDTIFAGERLKLLRLITNDVEEEVKYDTIQYDFKHDEYVDLNTREFDRITIRICDVTGELLQSDKEETMLLLVFKEVI